MYVCKISSPMEETIGPTFTEDPSNECKNS